MNVTGRTKIVGVIGDPITHTASPRMHQAGFHHLGLDFVMIPIHVKALELEAALRGLVAMNMVGCNVTIPHKEAVIPFLDHIDPSAKAIGAVNTIVNENGKLIGYNTDGHGFWLACEEERGVSASGKNISILGAGGSARALAYTALANGAESVTIINRNLERAEALSQALLSVGNGNVSAMGLDHPLIHSQLAASHLVIQCTPLGMPPHEDKCILSDFSWVSADQLLCDIIYQPAETRFLQHAQHNGSQTLGGAGMLAGQGLLAFEKFTGKMVPYAVMKNEV